MDTLQKWQQASVIVGIIGVIVTSVWWVAGFTGSYNNVDAKIQRLDNKMMMFERRTKAVEICSNKNESTIGKLELKVDALQEWIDRYRLLPEKLSSMEAQLISLNKQMESMGRNFDDFRRILMQSTQRRPL